VVGDHLGGAAGDDLAAAIALILGHAPAVRGASRPGQRWGLAGACDPASVISIQPADWAGGLQGFDSRVIRWEQLVYLPDDPAALLAEGPWAPPAPEPAPAPEPDANP
jgi:hypothetical protein